MCLCEQVQTTKGTGGDCLILEEAAYVDPGFFYETVAPLLLVGRASLLAISTLTSEFNFYTRLFKMYDKATLRPIFHSLQIELACAACQADGKTAECKHMLHLMPQWQSSERMIRLQTIMSDRPDLIESELSGIAANTLQSCFRGRDITTMFEQDPLPLHYAENLILMIDPAAGGPQSDYAMVSMVRRKGMVQVCCAPVQAAALQATRYALRALATKCCTVENSFRCHVGTTSLASAQKNPTARGSSSGASPSSGMPLQAIVLVVGSTFSSSRYTARAQSIP